MLLIGLCWALSSSAIYAQSLPEQGPLMAYVGTFSSPLTEPLPTQVDLPPGNGRGIHIFQVDRKTGQASLRGNWYWGRVLVVWRPMQPRRSFTVPTRRIGLSLKGVLQRVLRGISKSMVRSARMRSIGALGSLSI